MEVPEGILVDFGTSLTDENAQRVFDEASVNDVTEMRDLVEGYRSQNMFLNQEVLGTALWHIITSVNFFFHLGVEDESFIAHNTKS